MAYIWQRVAKSGIEMALAKTSSAWHQRHGSEIIRRVMTSSIALSVALHGGMA